MRVTNNMISNAVISNLGRSLERFMQLQSNMSTGRRINKPSDDPIGTHKDLRYRTSITEIEQLKKNISSSHNLMSTYDNVLGNMKDMLQSANELAIGMSNTSNIDPVANGVSADEVASLRQQIVDMANTRLSGRYVFSGFRTDTVSVREGVNGYQYDGDDGVTQVKVEASTMMSINLTAADVLFKPIGTIGDEADLNAGVNAGTELADLNLGNGVDLTNGTVPGTFVLTDNNLDAPGNTVSIDISTAVTLSDAIAQINNQLAVAGFTNISADYGLEGNNLRWVVNDSGLITDSTKLENLNSGEGVNLEQGILRFHTADDSIDVNIDISEAKTIGDVRTIINNDPTLQGAGIMAVINFATTGLDIIDTDWPATELMIDDLEESTTANDLGIQGTISSVLNGTDLHPVSDFMVEESETGQTTAENLGLAGSFNYDYSGKNLDPLLLSDTLLSDINSGNGIDQGLVKISQGTHVVELNLSTAVTVQDVIDILNGSGLDIMASINEAGTGIQIESTSDTESLAIQEVHDGYTAHEWGIYGSPDILGSLIVLEEAIRNGEEEDTSNLIENMYSGIDQLLSQRAMVGSKVVRLETADSRLTDQAFNFTKLLSEVEDADLTKLVADLATQENSYQAAMIASSKIIQPSLLNFLK